MKRAKEDSQKWKESVEAFEERLETMKTNYVISFLNQAVELEHLSRTEEAFEIIEKGLRIAKSELEPRHALRKILTQEYREIKEKALKKKEKEKLELEKMLTRSRNNFIRAHSLQRTLRNISQDGEVKICIDPFRSQIAFDSRNGGGQGNKLGPSLTRVPKIMSKTPMEVERSQAQNPFNQRRPLNGRPKTSGITRRINERECLKRIGTQKGRENNQRELEIKRKGNKSADGRKRSKGSQSQGKESKGKREMKILSPFEMAMEKPRFKHPLKVRRQEKDKWDQKIDQKGLDRSTQRKSSRKIIKIIEGSSKVSETNLFESIQENNAETWKKTEGNGERNESKETFDREITEIGQDNHEEMLNNWTNGGEEEVNEGKDQDQEKNEKKYEMEFEEDERKSRKESETQNEKEILEKMDDEGSATNGRFEENEGSGGSKQSSARMKSLKSMSKKSESSGELAQWEQFIGRKRDESQGELKEPKKEEEVFPVENEIEIKNEERKYQDDDEEGFKSRETRGNREAQESRVGWELSKYKKEEQSHGGKKERSSDKRENLSHVSSNENSKAFSLQRAADMKNDDYPENNNTQVRRNSSETQKLGEIPCKKQSSKLQPTFNKNKKEPSLKKDFNLENLSEKEPPRSSVGMSQELSHKPPFEPKKSSPKIQSPLKKEAKKPLVQRLKEEISNTRGQATQSAQSLSPRGGECIHHSTPKLKEKEQKLIQKIEDVQNFRFGDLNWNEMMNVDDESSSGTHQEHEKKPESHKHEEEGYEDDYEAPSESNCEYNSEGFEEQSVKS